MTAKIIDGKAIAEKVKEQVAKGVEKRVANGLRRPGLAVILVGDDAASQVYVRNKTNACEKVGFKSEGIILPSTTAQEEIEALIDRFNADEEIDGILVQLPLPEHLDSDALLERIKWAGPDAATSTAASKMALACIAQISG